MDIDRLRIENDILENKLKLENIKNKKIYQVEIHEKCEDEEQSEATGIKTIVDKLYIFPCFCYSLDFEACDDYLNFVDFNYKTISLTGYNGSVGVYKAKIDNEILYSIENEED